MRYNELTVTTLRMEPYAGSVLPPAANHPGAIMYSSTNTSPGVPTLAFSNGTSWFPISVSATPIS